MYYYGRRAVNWSLSHTDHEYLFFFLEKQRFITRKSQTLTEDVKYMYIADPNVTKKTFLSPNIKIFIICSADFVF